MASNEIKCLQKGLRAAKERVDSVILFPEDGVGRVLAIKRVEITLV